MGSGHVLAVPYPAQGHIIPLIELSQCLATQGFQITFVNSEYDHKRVTSALRERSTDLGDRINLVSIPDGLEPGEDRNDLGRLCESMLRVMPGKLEELINELEGENKISCVIADHCQGWVLEVADKLNIRRVAFWPAAVATLLTSLSIPKLIDDGIIDCNGTPRKNQAIQLAPTSPIFKSEHLFWACMGDETTQKIIFEYFLKNNKAIKLADKVICNSSHDLEPAAFKMAPEMTPIGPLLATSRLANSAGYYWPEDSSCLKWLDQHQPNSVIYVAFGSFTVFNQVQFHELALGLELLDKPFLWVVRADSAHSYPIGFLDRVGSRGKIVGWAPQQKVLSHGSIACFLSHCGWNSTVESVSNGVPILCWPYFGDQYLNEGYICEVWKVGLKLERDESGIVSKREIKEKVEKLVGDEEIRERACELEGRVGKSVGESGESYNNFKDFIEWLLRLI